MSGIVIGKPGTPAVDIVFESLVKFPAELSIPLIKLMNVQAEQDEFALPGFETSPESS